MNAKEQVSWEESQREVCKRHSVEFVACDPDSTLGIALATLSKQPINGLRHPAEKGTNGWYIWGGDFSSHSDFFEPLCARHVTEHITAVIPYLGLAPGWRFLLAPNQIDVWFDPDLLKASR